jgi:hypothetical protein
VASEVMLELPGGPRRVQSFLYGGRTIWGLTERILKQFVELVASIDAAPGVL